MDKQFSPEKQPSGQYCMDGDCHSQTSPLAILTAFNFTYVQVNSASYADPAGELFQRSEPILRPPTAI
ncbi:hypothetical protein [Photobacterium sagamiensis]|uniref:hypothetical protein n=1 Tax=Photobacterium sagamiensis TaxID=2910241 RepID=UPI003D0B4C9D